MSTSHSYDGCVQFLDPTQSIYCYRLWESVIHNTIIIIILFTIASNVALDVYAVLNNMSKM